MDAALNQSTPTPRGVEPLLTPVGMSERSADALLHAARTHLGMDVAFISEFLSDGTRIIRHVDCRADIACPLRSGDVVPLAEGYCQRVVDGRLPELIPDTAQVAETQFLPATRDIPIGAHLCVPLRLADGSVYGTFCCFSFRPDGTLNQRDLGMMRTLAALVAQQLDQDLAAHREHQANVHHIAGVIARGQPDLVYQPIYELLLDWSLCGVECLSRFRAEPTRGPDQWFAEARRVGLGPTLELAAIRRALAELRALSGDFSISVNCDPETVLSGELPAALEGVPPERLVVEITEHARVDNYAQLAQSLDGLRSHGVRLAIDDAGAGYASMSHILSLHPDFIKLDISLTRGIDNDWMRHSLASALVEFARCVGSAIVAEGVETPGELAALHRLGVQRAQGYFLSTPLPLPDLTTLLQKH